MCTQLKVNFDVSHLEEFPPKRMLSLSEEQLQARRRALEKYFHSGTLQCVQKCACCTLLTNLYEGEMESPADTNCRQLFWPSYCDATQSILIFPSWSAANHPLHPESG